MSVPQCTHVLDSGTVCGSPALNDRKYCFFHIRLRQRPVRRDDGSVHLILHDLTSVESIQIAVSNVLHALNDGLIDSRKANSLYRGLALALSALRFKASEAKQKSNESEAGTHLPSFARLLSLLPDDHGSRSLSSDTQQECAPGIPASAEPECGADIPVRPQAQTTEIDATNPAEAPETQQLATPLSNVRVKSLRRIIRQGPRHPQFHHAARLLDKHTAAVANLRSDVTACAS